MEKQKIQCQNCGTDIPVNMTEFVDISTDPVYKEKIMDGSFFMVKCPSCGDETLVEYPVMYMDPSKKLTVYMVPDHEDDLLDNLNSLDVPETDLNPEAEFRLVNCSSELLEKILLRDNNRDDRVIELYKALICENIKEDWPDVTPDAILYYKEPDDEYFIIWDYVNAAGEQLTVNLDEELYEDLKTNYISAMDIPLNKYAEVNNAWLLERVNVE